MKTLVDAVTHVSMYLFEDSEVIFLAADRIVVGEPASFVIADCNLTNTVLFEGVEAPDDWCGRKYVFDGSTWTSNADFFDPRRE